MAEPFDYLIVGAGAAGCVLANRLSEDPKVRVGLVEAGPDRNARKMLVKMPLAMVTFMAPALAFLGGPKFMSWFETEPEPGLQGRKIALPRGRGVGLLAADGRGEDCHDQPGSPQLHACALACQP